MEQIRYFDSQVFTPENEMSPAEAAGREYYVACYCVEGAHDLRPERAEIVHRTDAGREIQRVLYYDRPLPHVDLLRQHVTDYPHTPAEILLPIEEEAGWTVSMAYRYDRDGELKGIREARQGPREHLEIRRDPEGNVRGSIEREYDEEGELLVVRERLADGTLISEDFAIP